MALKLYYHPLSSFCHKVLIALYENAVPFEPRIVNLGDAKSRDAFLKLWPVGRFPVIVHDGHIVPESSIVIEYLLQHFPGPVKLIPDNAAAALEVRQKDRFYDLYLNVPMQKIVTDNLRPAGQSDAFGVEQSRAQLKVALSIVDQEMASKQWATGETFSMADCAATPALFYADRIAPLAVEFKNVAAYLERLKARPSVARVLQEAEPYLAMFPM